MESILIHVSFIFLIVKGQEVLGAQRFLEEPRSLISAPGGSVTFTCLVSNKGGECRLTMKQVGHKDSRKYLVTVTNMHGSDTAPVHLTVRAPMPLTSAITAASILALSLIMLVCTCILCRTKRKLCFKAAAEKELVAQNGFNNKAESKISLVNETKDKVSGVSPLKINPHSTKV